MIAIDAGNTRIKWGVHNGAGWQSLGAVPTQAPAELAAAAAHWPAADAIVACNVAGEGLEKALEKALKCAFAPHFPGIEWLRPTSAACGVTNRYALPDRLGADRWAALIAARADAKAARLIVCAGTATTVDWLDANGVFRGGLILPGVDLMRASLARNTAQLPLAAGEFCSEPRTTVDAIESGCLHAQIGAIERMFANLAGEPGALCLLTGGAAHRLAPLLAIPFRPCETLILDGLRHYARVGSAEPGKVAPMPASAA